MTNPYDKNKAISADEAAKIIPRAEFRVFGKNIIAGVQEHMWKCKATLYAARVMPEEIYFLDVPTKPMSKFATVCLTLRLKSEKHRRAMKSFSLAANLNSQLNGKSWAKSSSISKLRLN